MGVLAKKEGVYYLFVKGAPEAIKKELKKLPQDYD